ncbi:hypothetical protein [Methanococcoides burtonii]|uniref:Uncharacterized protein n=1 Tax=Methanococcoides burtonii (strain DSM 6242 / NBRC 107633 / OCM 468 / ACE-M) TaxID=259564 RepID=Q12TZ9_METBU|nr:hypothetical protein [Methanococcoides burtonii]ABE53077.1 Hypothetical protein Mbur_2213 [Methanococcoides burtonii DSM 6242]
MEIKPWNVEAGNIKIIKAGDMLLTVKSESQAEDPSKVVQILCDATKAFVDTFDVDVREIIRMLSEDDAQLASNSEIQIQEQQGQIADSNDSITDLGTSVASINFVRIYSNVLNRMKEEFTDTFTTGDVVELLKEFWPNNGDGTLRNRARSHIRYLNKDKKIELTGKQGRAQIWRFIEIQNVAEE